MNELAKQAFRWLLPILWMAVIFSFSAEPADQSDQMSLSVGGYIGRTFVKDFEQLSPKEQLAFAEKLNYPIRKAAHGTEYAILSCLVLFALQKYRMSSKKKYVLAFLITVVYAASDEFHQLFVPGRSCQVTDVMIDSCGAIVGLLVACGIHKWLTVERCRKKRLHQSH